MLLSSIVTPKPDSRSQAALGAALAARAYFRVYPTRPVVLTDQGVRCLCPDPRCAAFGKHPCMTGYRQLATRDEGRIAKLWGRQFPGAGIAAVLGPDDLVLDVDRRNDGATSLARVEQELGLLPPTRTHVTPDGEHRIFRLPPGVRVRGGKGVLADGLDVLTMGDSLVLPPSAGRGGRPYAVLDDREPAVVSEGLLAILLLLDQEQAQDRLVAPQDRWVELPPLPASTDRLAAYWHAACGRELALLAGAVRGSRNITAFGCARRLAQLFEVCRPGEGKVIGELVATAVATGLSTAEAEQTIASGLRAGRLRPRGPRERPTGPSRATGSTVGLHARMLAAAEADPSLPAGAVAVLRGELAGAHGKPVWRQAVRESAKEGRISEGTVVYGRKCLVARGWLAPVLNRPNVVVNWRHGQSWMPGSTAMSEAAKPEHSASALQAAPRTAGTAKRSAAASGSGGASGTLPSGGCAFCSSTVPSPRLSWPPCWIVTRIRPGITWPSSTGSGWPSGGRTAAGRRPAATRARWLGSWAWPTRPRTSSSVTTDNVWLPPGGRGSCAGSGQRGGRTCAASTIQGLAAGRRGDPLQPVPSPPAGSSPSPGC